MASDTEPSSLYKLCFNSLMKHVKSGSLDIETLEFPPDIGDQIMVNFIPLEIISHAFHPKTVNWFYYNVFYTKQLKIWIQHNRIEYNICLANPDLKESWLKWRLSSRTARTQCFPVNIGNVVLPTKAHGSKSFTSYVPDKVHTPDKIIEWICTLFRCDVFDGSVLAGGEVYKYLIGERKKTYPWVKNCTRLTVTDCEDTWALRLLSYRQDRKMRTTLFNPVFDRWVYYDMTLSGMTKVTNGRFNVKRLKTDQLIKFLIKLTNRSMDILELQVEFLSVRDIRKIKDQIRLKDNSQELMESLERNFVSAELDFTRHTEEHTKLFSFNEDGSVVGFYFYSLPQNGNLFHKVLCHGFSPRNENMG